MKYTTFHEVNEDTSLANGRSLLQEIVRSGSQEDAFQLCNLEVIKRNLKVLKDRLPLHYVYDVSHNRSPFLLKFLANQGCDLACRCKNEVQAVLDAGIDSDKVRFMSTMLVASHLKMAIANGVNTFMFRTEADLRKIGRFAKEGINLILCLDPRSVFEDASTTEFLLSLALEMGFDVVGITLQIDEPSMDDVDSQFLSNLPLMIENVVSSGLQVGHNITEISFGNVVQKPETMEAIKNHLSLIKDFKFSSVIDESLVSAAFVVAVKIIGKREHKEDSEKCFTYVLNEGIFGLFGSALHSDNVFTASTLLENEQFEDGFRCNFWGPSGDDMDTIGGEHILPEMEVGEWILFENMGASAWTDLTCFQAPDIWNSKDDDFWIILKQKEKNHEKSARFNFNSLNAPEFNAFEQEASTFNFDDLLPEMLLLSGNTQL